jgi:dolichol-phosphate mannosyltransferase
MKNPLLSIVIPAYNEEENIQNTARVVQGIMDEALIPYELVFISDGSKDTTFDKVLALAKTDRRIRGLEFSRNFGKEAAIFAGLRAAKGGCAVVMDCDLQHPPKTIVEMYRLWEQGYEIIEGQKSSRGEEGKLHALAAKVFYKIISAATKFDMENASDFKLMDRKAVNVLLSMREKNAFFRALSSWIGFKTTYIEFDVQERTAGESKWSTRALTKYALTNITSFSTAPMQVVTVLGGIMFVVRGRCWDFTQ